MYYFNVFWLCFLIIIIIILRSGDKMFSVSPQPQHSDTSQKNLLDQFGCQGNLLLDWAIRSTPPPFLAGIFCLPRSDHQIRLSLQPLILSSVVYWNFVCLLVILMKKRVLFIPINFHFNIMSHWKNLSCILVIFVVFMVCCCESSVCLTL